MTKEEFWEKFDRNLARQEMYTDAIQEILEEVEQKQTERLLSEGLFPLSARKKKGRWSMFGKKAKMIEELKETIRSYQAEVCEKASSIQFLRSRVKHCEQKNFHRTSDGQHICERCGVVYVPLAQGPLYNLVWDWGVALDSKVIDPRVYGDYKKERYKASNVSLLLQEVNSDRFCPDCEEELQETLNELKFLADEETQDHEVSCAFRGGLYKLQREKEEEKKA